jgi:hypothetical protein
MIAVLITGRHISPAGVVFLVGVLLLGGAGLSALAMAINRFNTRKWGSPSNANYVSSVKQTFYLASRTKWFTYAMLGMAAAGILLMVVALFMWLI